MSRSQVGVFGAVFVAIWAVISAVQNGGEVLPVQLLEPFPLAVGAMTLLVAAYDRWIWSWPGVRQSFSKRPDLRGTWAVTLKSDYENPETGERVDPIDCFMVIRQTFSRVSLRLMTKESESDTVSATLLTDADGCFSIAAVYRNTPQVEFHQRSTMHLGAMDLRVRDGGLSIDGTYWTLRKTKGDMFLKNRQRDVYDTYERAAAARAATECEGTA